MFHLEVMAKVMHKTPLPFSLPSVLLSMSTSWRCITKSGASLWSSPRREFQVFLSDLHLFVIFHRDAGGQGDGRSVNSDCSEVQIRVQIEQGLIKAAGILILAVEGGVQRCE